jgi:hypothetical protein
LYLLPSIKKELEKGTSIASKPTKQHKQKTVLLAEIPFILFDRVRIFDRFS